MNFVALTKEVLAAVHTPYPLPSASEAVKIKVEISRFIDCYLAEHHAFSRACFPSDDFDHTAPASLIEAFAFDRAAAIRDSVKRAIQRTGNDSLESLPAT